MFSAAGNKRIMLENLKKSKTSGKPIHEIAPLSRTTSIIPPSSPSTPRTNKEERGNSTPNAGRVRITSESIESDLNRTDNHGTSVRKIAKAVAGFRVDRDGMLLDAFRTKKILYADFRMMLKRVFALTFTEDEFDYICEMFDIYGDRATIDGPEFVVAMRLLGSAWKAREMRSSRKQLELSEQQQRDREEQEKAEKEAIEENACDPFGESDLRSAVEKLTAAATKFSRTDPTAPSLQAFEVKYLKPTAFKVLLKNTFAIVVNRRELGALVEMFQTEAGHCLVDSADFVLRFCKIGVEQRDLKRKKQIEMTAKAERDALAHQQELLKNVGDSLEAVYDPNFEEADLETALLKIRVAAKAYRKHGGAGNMSLDGFNSVYITPGLFREMLKRTFNVALTGKELGAITKYFDKDNTGDIYCQSFLVHFTKVGTAERGKDHIMGLQKQWAEIEARKKKEQEKLDAAAKRNLVDQSKIGDFTDTDMDNAIAKFREAARHYTVNIADVPGSLDAFSVASMFPGVFQEKCARILRVNLSNGELGAMVAKFDLRGDRSEVDCPAFGRFMKRLGFEEKEKLWKMEKKMRDKSEADKHARMEKVKEEFGKSLEVGAIAMDFTEEDRSSGIKKLQFAASQIDPTAATQLNTFAGISITPGQLREKLKSALGVRLTARELGAVAAPIMLSDGSISCPELTNLMLALAREVREDLRLKRIAAERIEREKMLKHQHNLLEEKNRVEGEILQHDHTHEQSLLNNLNSAAQMFTLDP
jgi:Ca2+-binding EF-hand superfamily protein